MERSKKKTKGKKDGKNITELNQNIHSHSVVMI